MHVNAYHIVLYYSNSMKRKFDIAGGRNKTMTEIEGFWTVDPDEWFHLECVDGMTRDIRHIRCGPDIVRELEVEFSSEEFAHKSMNFDTTPPPSGWEGIVCIEPENAHEFGYEWNEPWVVLPLEFFDELDSKMEDDKNEWVLYCPSEELCYSDLSLHEATRGIERTLYDTRNWAELGKFWDHELMIAEVPDTFILQGLRGGPVDDKIVAHLI